MATMSWRRFQVLLRCLSPNSATVARLQAHKFIGSSSKGSAIEVKGAKAADRAFASLFKPSKPGKRKRKKPNA